MALFITCQFMYLESFNGFSRMTLCFALPPQPYHISGKGDIFIKAATLPNLNSLKAWDYFITHKLSTTDRILLFVYSQPPLITSCICTYFISSVPYPSDKELFSQPIPRATQYHETFKMVYLECHHQVVNHH